MTNKPSNNQNPIEGSSTGPSTDSKSQVDIKKINIPEIVTVKELSHLMAIESIELIKNLMRNGFMLSINDVIERDIAVLLAKHFGFEVLPLAKQSTGTKSQYEKGDGPNLNNRPPVIAILGHVDHGKTTLLDSIRKTNVVSNEAGGITQHIGAYQIKHNENPITFIDTPGHAAFTQMRARGANITDIVILVVAADDGIMPQTIEAINHIKAANVPMIVAINKIDSPTADSDRVKRQLSENNILIEEWGGEIISCEVSALKGEGLNDLLENILLLSEILELKSDINKNAQGVIIEASLDKNSGPSTTLLVQNGTLMLGDFIYTKKSTGKIKSIVNDVGEKLTQAEPSLPVKILGLDSVPEAGSIFQTTKNSKSLKQELSETSISSNQAKTIQLENLRANSDSQEVTSLNIILKTDFQGTIQPLVASIENLGNDEQRLNVIHASSGGISENDILLASTSNAIVFGFNVFTQPSAQKLAAKEVIKIRDHTIIYELLDDIKSLLDDLAEPIKEDIVAGIATVKATFSYGKNAKIAGIIVNEGTIKRGNTIHLMRNNQLLHKGPMRSLRHFKDDVKELNSGFEGGLVLEAFQDIKEGDIIEAHSLETK
ncbi:MAG: translation initiation factor IF-2 [SAR202 cluster bacterium]|nr:translation initiation factor IF-2 [SAR202 cluster bacterium]|tara:strand:+ start:428 stop:2236 length:1809 start_codon:yes stop_codon:yes gene_type:complete